MDLNHRMEASEAPALPLGDPGMLFQLSGTKSETALVSDYGRHTFPSGCGNSDKASEDFQADGRLLSRCGGRFEPIAAVPSIRLGRIPRID